MSNDDFHQVLNMWLREIKDVYYKNREELELIEDEKDRVNRMVELNVKAQVEKLAKTSIIQKAWKERGAPVLHGWVYGLADGQLHALHTIQPDTNIIDPIYVYDDLK